MSNAIVWTKLRRAVCVCRMITRVGAFESWWSKLTFEYPSYGLATSRKFSAGVWNFLRRKFGVSKTAINRRFQTLRRYIEKKRRFLMAGWMCLKDKIRRTPPPKSPILEGGVYLYGYIKKFWSNRYTSKNILKFSTILDSEKDFGDQ